nr:MAG TPA: hypothetical protein [Caudoviricetes sp.]
MPGSQHITIRRCAVGGQRVDVRAMGMTVDQMLHLMFFHHVHHRLWVDVHDSLGFVAVGGGTVSAHFRGDTHTDKQRQGEKQFLQPGLVDFGAKRLIACVIGTQGVAVQDQQPFTVQLKHLFFRQQRHAAFTRKALTEQKITIAVNEINRDAGISQRFQGGGDLAMQRVGIVIADPGFKQIAQNVQRIGFLRRTGQKTQKTGGDRRFFCLQMEICNKECRHRLLADGHAFNDHVFFRHVLMHTAATGRNRFDFINHVHAFSHFGEYAITPALQVFTAEVQEVVIYHVDEELRGSRVRSLSTGHCQRTTGVFQTVVRFVFDRLFGLFLLHTRFKTAALDHKAIDHTVENGVVVKTFTAVVEEVFNGFRCFIIKGFDYDIAVISVESNHCCILFCLVSRVDPARGQR